VRALRRLLAEPLDGHVAPSAIDSVELLRTKYKPGRTLTGYYRWRADTRNVAARTWYADGRTSVLIAPVDPVMPQLSRLYDPTELAELLGTIMGEAVCGSPSDLILRTIRYRPGERHVLHVRGGLLTPSGVYLKLDRHASGAYAVPVVAELVGHVKVARPLGYLEADGIAAWQGSPGRSLAEWLRDRPQDGPRLVYQVGRGLRAIHDSHVRVGRSNSAAAEVAATLRAGGHLRVLRPRDGDLFRSLVERAAAALDRSPAEGGTLTHGDVKCDNLLVDGQQGVRFLDLDRVAVGEPALDLGKFLADLRWCCPEGRLPALRSALRAGYGACDPVRWVRADLVAVILGARLVAHRCAVHDPAFAVAVHVRLAGVGRQLETGGVRR
jgi:hypothetical protein